MLKFLYIYKWCTFGGVERVLLNRAIAFKKFAIPVKIDVFFYYGGVKSQFNEYIAKFKLQDYIEITESLDFKKYTKIVSIDTPEVFDNLSIEKVILEYHTSYEDHGKYIYNLPDTRIERVVVPSNYFAEVLRTKNPKLAERCVILRNFVIDEAFEEKDFHLPDWNLVPLVWIGRVDRVKNPHFVVSALKEFRKLYADKAFFCVVGSSHDEQSFIKHIESEKMSDRVIFYPNLKFERIKAFLKKMKERRAIFVSASLGESFGMAVAEAIYFGLPVLVSDIPPHRYLVEGDEDFLFEIGNKDQFCKKLDNLIQNYEYFAQKTSKFVDKLKPEGFIKDWEEFVKILKL